MNSADSCNVIAGYTRVITTRHGGPHLYEKRRALMFPRLRRNCMRNAVYMVKRNSCLHVM